MQQVALKRVNKDIKEFLANPLPGCFISQREDKANVCDCIIQWRLDDHTMAPLHLVVKFPNDYPMNAPSVGFSCSDIGYREGASMTERSDVNSVLYGKLSICLDMLGNFAQVHTEWADNRGSGWSPAYSISALLVNLQAVLATCAGGMNAAAKNRVISECNNFFKSIDVSSYSPDYSARPRSDHVPVAVKTASAAPATAIPHESPAGEAAVAVASNGKVFKTDGLISLLAERMRQVEAALNLRVSYHKVLETYSSVSDSLGATLCWEQAPASLCTVCREALVEARWDPVARRAIGEEGLTLNELLKSLRSLRNNLILGGKRSAAVDPEMTCWYSQEHYSEAILGFGITFSAQGRRTNLSTDGALISLTAYKSGLRQTPMKDSFSHFLPVWICPTHSVDSASGLWKSELMYRVGVLGQELDELERTESRNATNEQRFARYVLRVYPDLINLIIVRMMQPESDVRASERVFRVLIDLWRTMKWLTDEYPEVRRQAVGAVRQFTADSSRRSKEDVPNIGWLLALRTVVSNEEVPFASFFEAYVEESFMRGVMWWVDSSPSSSTEVYKATAVSRHLLLFQSIIIRVALGCKESSQQHTAALADATECKLDAQCSEVMAQWKQALKVEGDQEKGGAPAHVKWGTHFASCNCPVPYQDNDVQSWIDKKIAKAATTPGYFRTSGGQPSAARTEGGGRGRGGRGRGAAGAGGRGGGNNRW